MSKIDVSKLEYRPCVGIMVLNRDGLIWLGQRSDAKQHIVEGPGTWWQMPQGGIDKGEDPKLAAIRELQEELSLIVEPGQHLTTQTKHDGRLVLYCWSARILSGEPIPSPKEDAEVKWMSPEAIRARDKVLHGTTDILDLTLFLSHFGNCTTDPN